ncbi:MAG: vitamin K epoxide reductase family protein [Marmoricola sp.]
MSAPPADRRAAATYPAWARLSTFALAIAGLGVSLYLAIEHARGSTSLACPDTGLFNCHLVTTSTYSELAGMPVAYLGFAFYLGAMVLFSPWTWRLGHPILRWLRLGAVLTGVAMVLYLVWAELYRIHGICLWCTSVHLITFLLFALTVLSEAAGPIEP